MTDVDVQLVSDMLDFSRRAERLVAGRDEAPFLADEAAVFAVRYCLPTLGECAKRVSEDVKSELPNAPWKEMAGMRDRLAHGYNTVRDAVLYETVVQELPPSPRPSTPVSPPI